MVSRFLVGIGSLVFAGIACANSVSVASQLGAANGFVLLALADGDMTINSATSITGNVGYSNGVVSHTNQKVDAFTGTAYVHSGADFQFTAATFVPTGGIISGGAANTLLNQANIDAVAAATYFAGLSPTGSLGNVSSSLELTATGDLNVYDVASLNFNTATLKLHGDSNDLFLFRVGGSFDWSHAQTILDGVSSGQVVFYFPNASNVNINKADNVFIGTILGTTAIVDYHNPATFEGAILAKSITVHSDFNIKADTEVVPEPSFIGLLSVGLVALCAGRHLRRKKLALER